MQGGAACGKINNTTRSLFIDCFFKLETPGRGQSIEEGREQHMTSYLRQWTQLKCGCTGKTICS